jgi:hypothetical protein
VYRILLIVVMGFFGLTTIRGASKPSYSNSDDSYNDG